MPELPEVETARRTLQRVLQGHRIAAAEVVPDEIVLKGASASEMEAHLAGAKVNSVGRKGKYLWLELDRKPWVFCHLGMAGWIRELGAPSIRLREHGNAPFEDETGRPRFLKLLLRSGSGRAIAFTDGRRLARIWTAQSPEADRAVKALGPDCLDGLPVPPQLQAMLQNRSAPIKSLLLDQSLFAGVGNWIADEVLFHSRIAPSRSGSSLSLAELRKLRKALIEVIALAVDVGADSSRYPSDWLFHSRWGGKKGTTLIGKHEIVRATIGGRTTAWAPQLQK